MINLAPYDALLAKTRNGLLFALLFLLPFDLYPRFELYGATIRLSQVVGLCLIVASAPLLWRKGKDWLSTPWVFLAAFLVASVFASIFAFNPSRAFATTSYYAFSILLAYAVAATFSLKDSKTYLKIVFGVSVFVSLFGLYQFFGDSAGLSIRYTLLLPQYTKVIFGFPRIQALSLEPLYLANYLIIPFSLSFAAYISQRKHYQLVISGFFLTIILLTVARGAYFAVGAICLVGLAVMAARKMYKQCLWFAFAGVLAIVATVGMIRMSGVLASKVISKTAVPRSAEKNLPDQTVSPEGNSTRLLYHVGSFGTDGSVLDRKKTAARALKVGLAHPILGVGPGNFGRYVVAQYPNEYKDVAQTVNNEPAEIFAEVGVLGLIALAGFAAWILSRAFLYSLASNSEAANIWFLGTGFMMLGFAVQWQTFSTLYITHIWVMIGIFVGVALGSKNRSGLFVKLS